MMRSAFFLSVVVLELAAAQDTCSSVTVTGGDYPGVYSLGDGDTYVGDDEGRVLRPVSFGESRARRNLGGGRDGGRRGLANDCENQIWVLADMPTVEEEGFPYYTAFDCAVDPSTVESTWLKVDCEDCAEVAPITVTCTTSVGGDPVLTGDDGGDDGWLTLPVIIGIALGGLVLLVCFGYCFSRHKKRAHKGSHTFADDSEHSLAPPKNGGGVGVSGGAVVAGARNGGGHRGKGPPPEYSADVGEEVQSPLGVAAAGDGSRRQVIAKGANAKSFKPNHHANPAYEGIFASRSAGGGGTASSQGGASSSAHPAAVELAKSFNPEVRKDSMAAAASAAAAARSQGGGSSNLQDVDIHGPEALGSVLSSGVVGNTRGAPPQYQEGRAPRGAEGSGSGGDGGGITWTAGQNLNHRRGGYEQSDYGGDSAAGSLYDLRGPDDEEHQYYDDDECMDSVAASSPGAYSIYSHYTAGGGVYHGGGPLTGSAQWSDDDSVRPEERANGAGGGGATTIPSPAGQMMRSSERSMPGGGGDRSRR